MFSKRYDGQQVKSLDPIFKLMPHVMERRSDAQIFYRHHFSSQPLNDYIQDTKGVDIPISHMHIVIAAMVRMLALRPSLNRFIINGRIFARRRIWVSFAIKKALTDEADETTIKLEFKGTETLWQIAERINDELAENKKPTSRNITDNLAAFFMNLPNGFVKLSVGFIKWMDKAGILPGSIIDASPFHTSFFLTNVKSIGLEALYHHIYDFGTTSIFISMGKEYVAPTMTADGMQARKFMDLGVTLDERICDGLYVANSIKLIRKFLKTPALLEEPLDSIVPDVP